MVAVSYLLCLALSTLVFGKTTSKASNQVISFTPKLSHQKFTTKPSKKIKYVSDNSDDPEKVAKAFIRLKFKGTPTDYVIKSMHRSKSTKVTHVYLRQVIDGKEVLNGNINLNINSKGHILSYGDSFYRFKEGNSIGELYFPTRITEAEDSIKPLLKYINIKSDGRIKYKYNHSSKKRKVKFTNIPKLKKPGKAQLAWLQLEGGKLEAVWEYKLDFGEDYFNGCVSAISDKTVMVANWARDATYNVVEFGKKSVADGGISPVTDPADDIASPLGWHDVGGDDGKSTVTAGNNAFATRFVPQSNDDKDPRGPIKGTDDLVFDYPFYEDMDPFYSVEASTVNLFYYVNKVHDIFYRFGFDESAGNFQENNMGKGGKENDPIIAHAQHVVKRNNARFVTPPDGKSGVLYMHVYAYPDQDKDTGFDSSILIHELTHGLSNRLVGGPKNANCLSSVEAAALGEGWSDALANLFLIGEDDGPETDIGVGKYASNRETVRKKMYSTNKKTNPWTYHSLTEESFKEVHTGGEVWANTIYEIYWNLRTKLGYTSDWKGEGAVHPKKYGNSLLLLILIEGMKTLDCNPTFLDARDAIIQAEKLLTKGENKCELWEGFAKRGMGLSAKVVKFNKDDEEIDLYVNSKEKPDEC